MRIFISIPGDPKSLKRHRTVKVGKFMKEYDPSSEDKSTLVNISYAQRPDKPLGGPISMTVKAFFIRPKSHFYTGKRADILRTDAPMFKTSKPDASNIVKLLEDAYNKIMFHDDSQICMLQVIKLYSETPRTEILIEQL